MALAAPLTLQQVVARTEDLPSMMVVALAVAQETQSDTATAQSVAALLSQDPALTSRMLRLANSPYYGLLKQAKHASEAVLILGMRAVRDLCLVAATYPWFTRPVPGGTEDPGALWSHSFATASGARLLARRTSKADPDEAFTAGLLCDVGKIALMTCYEGKARPSICDESEDVPVDTWERARMGFDHAEAGGELAEKWNLPSAVVSVARHHHRPRHADSHRALVDVVHVADAVSSLLGYGLTEEGLRYEFDETAVERLGVKSGEIDQLASELVQAYDENQILLAEAGLGVTQ